MRMRVRFVAPLTGSCIQPCCELWYRSKTQLRSHLAGSLAAAALIQPLAWELPYAGGMALKRKTKTEQTKKDYTYKSYHDVFVFCSLPYFSYYNESLLN